MTNRYEQPCINRQKYIDVARGFVIVLMLIGHSGVPDWIRQLIYGFHMPFFFILSGILYDKLKWDKLGIKTLIKRRWKAYVIPYFVLSFINLLINIPVEYYCDGIKGKELLYSTLKHIFWIFYSYGTTSRTPNCTPLWFLPCIFLSSIYLYFLLKVKSTSLQILICVTASTIDYLLFKLNIMQLPWHIDAALLGMVFMYIGLWIKEKKLLDTTSNCNLLSLSLLPIGIYCIFNNGKIDINLHILNNIVLMYVGAICISFVLILFFKNYFYNNSLLEFWGKNTIIFMAFNYAINTYSKIVWNRIPLFSNFPYTWWKKTIVDIIVLHILCILWNKMKHKKHL